MLRILALTSLLIFACQKQEDTKAPLKKLPPDAGRAAAPVDAAPPPPRVRPDAEPPPAIEIPADLSVSYRGGPVAAEMGPDTVIELRPAKDGWEYVRWEERKMNKPPRKEMARVAVPKERLGWLVQAIDAGFFGLAASHEDPGVRDGGRS